MRNTPCRVQSKLWFCSTSSSCKTPQIVSSNRLQTTTKSILDRKKTGLTGLRMWGNWCGWTKMKIRDHICSPNCNRSSCRTTKWSSKAWWLQAAKCTSNLETLFKAAFSTPRQPPTKRPLFLTYLNQQLRQPSTWTAKNALSVAQQMGSLLASSATNSRKAIPKISNENFPSISLSTEKWKWILAAW